MPYPNVSHAPPSSNMRSHGWVHATSHKPGCKGSSYCLAVSRSAHSTEVRWKGSELVRWVATSSTPLQNPGMAKSHLQTWAGLAVILQTSSNSNPSPHTWTIVLSVGHVNAKHLTQDHQINMPFLLHLSLHQCNTKKKKKTYSKSGSE